MSDASSRKGKKGFIRTSAKALNRKLSMNMPSLSNTLDALAFASAGKKGKKSFKKQGTIIMGGGVGDYSDAGGDSVKGKKKGRKGVLKT